MEVFNGRPQDISGREEKERRVYDLLDRLGIAYQRVDHAPAETMEACEAVDRALDVRMCKNLFLCNRKKTKFYLLMMPGDKPFKTKELAGQHGIQRLSFADEEYMQEFLDIRPGAVSIMGLMNDREHRVQLLMDEDIPKEEFIGCHPCVNTASLKIRTEDILGTFLQEVGHDPLMVSLEGKMD